MYNNKIMNDKQTALLKRIRSLTGLSQAKFAKKYFKKTASCIQHMEDGYKQVLPWAAKIYVKVAKKYGLNITLDDLYE